MTAMRTVTGQALRGQHRARRRLFPTLIQRALTGLTQGTIVLLDSGREHRYGDGAPVVTVDVRDSGFYRRLALGGSVGAGEAYMEGEWECDDLVGLVRIMLANATTMARLEGFTTAVVAAVNRLSHLTRRNSRRGSRRNIEAHYDLSNAFFETFLDDSMMYSAAVFESPTMSLEEASEAKLERLCRKLELKPDDHLLEIGSGWGGLAAYAAERFGCRVTTATISPAQHRAAVERIRGAGLDERVDVLLADYRDLRGRYDKVVSVEMVEAVGHEHLEAYFAQLDRLLRPGGLLALQAITVEDQRYRQALDSVDFIKKHVFPGSFIPCVSRLVDAAAQSTDTVLVNLEDLARDYAETLAEWRRRVEANRERILALGFDERFLRMWRFYLCYCEGAFRERAISDVQLLFAKVGYRGQPWRARLSADGAGA